MEEINQVLNYFTGKLKENIKLTLEQYKYITEDLQEIRIRINRPIILKFRQADIIIEYFVSQTELLQILERLCENSIYAYKNEICEGFITIRGGHRIGVIGTAVTVDGNVINMKYITSLNFRIAKQVINCSNKILGEVIDCENNTINTTLIVSPPGKGKTTILRDLIRQISNGVQSMNFQGRTCGVVDERGEIAAIYRGIPQNDIGIRTDVVDHISKAKGMKMLIRSMAPEVIACDEIRVKRRC